MNTSIFLLGLGISVLGVLALSSNIRMRFAPYKKISEVLNGSRGTVILRGLVSKEKTILSAVSQTPCVYCAYRTFQRGRRRGHNARGTSQSVLGSGIVRTDFILDDKTGSITVAGGWIYGDTKHTKNLDDDSREYERQIRAFKEKTSIGEAEDREYEEDLILPGDEVYVQGKKTSDGKFKAGLITLSDFKKKTGSLGGLVKEAIPLLIGIVIMIKGM